MSPVRLPSASRLARGAAVTGAEADQMLRAAVRAPSLHNTQPWSFAVGAHHVEVYADPTRQLRAVDPNGRSLLISCGAALLNLRVAAEDLGFHPVTRLLPDDDDPTLLALVALSHRHRASDGLAGYADALDHRRTDRTPFADQPVPRRVLTALGEAATAEGALLGVHTDPDAVERIVALLHDADLAEHVDAARAADVQAWVGTGRSSDGVPVRSLGPVPAQQRAAFRDLDAARGRRRSRGYATFEAAPTIAVLSTMRDRPVDWLRAGQALERVLLEATASGLSASFLNQPLEQPDLRWQVRDPLADLGQPQMLLRLGYGGRVPATPRRPLSQVLRDRPRINP